VRCSDPLADSTEQTVLPRLSSGPEHSTALTTAMLYRAAFSNKNPSRATPDITCTTEGVGSSDGTGSFDPEQAATVSAKALSPVTVTCRTDRGYSGEVDLCHRPAPLESVGVESLMRAPGLQRGQAAWALDPASTSAGSSVRIAWVPGGGVEPPS
jgi:hypothetical protein